MQFPDRALPSPCHKHFEVVLGAESSLEVRDRAIKKVLIAVAKYVDDAIDVCPKENRLRDKINDMASAAQLTLMSTQVNSILSIAARACSMYKVGSLARVCRGGEQTAQTAYSQR